MRGPIIATAARTHFRHNATGRALRVPANDLPAQVSHHPTCANSPGALDVEPHAGGFVVLPASSGSQAREGHNGSPRTSFISNHSALIG